MNTIMFSSMSRAVVALCWGRAKRRPRAISLSASMAASVRWYTRRWGALKPAGRVRLFLLSLFTAAVFCWLLLQLLVLLGVLQGWGGETRAPMTDAAIAEATVGRLDRFDDVDYMNTFRRLATRPHEGRPYFLSWGYWELANASVTELAWQMGGMGTAANLKDQVVVYKPMCVDTWTGAVHRIAGGVRCGGFNHTYMHFSGGRCDYIRRIAREQTLLNMSASEAVDGTKAFDAEWIDAHANDIRWVKGLTVLQALDRSCGNIAHFMGRILFLHHVLSNLEAYSLPPRNPANILITASPNAMKRFTHPEQHNYYHFRLLKALIAPHNFTVGTFGDFLAADEEERLKGSVPFVYLLHNLTMPRPAETDGDVDNSNSNPNTKSNPNANPNANANANANPDPKNKSNREAFGGLGEDEEVEVMDKKPGSGSRYVCFKRVIAPTFLRGRFFISDHEYPSTKASIMSVVPGAPRVPRDAIRLRGRLNAWHDAVVGFQPRRRLLMLFDRAHGTRRVFDPAGRSLVLNMLRRVAGARGYSVAVRDFTGVPFDRQYGEVRQVAVGVGIHGANLVNAVFMPPLSSLIEIFPHGFDHVMYRGGGNAGLKYFRFEMSPDPSKGEFPDLARYPSKEECITYSAPCKRFYRDATVVVSPKDADRLAAVIEQAIDWSDTLP